MNDRALTIRSRRRAQFSRASAIFDPVVAAALPFTEGLACTVRGGAAEGWLLLGEIRSMSADQVELGRELGNVIATFIERQALLQAIERGAAVSARHSVHGDLQNRTVRFLAGAASRLEALHRAAPPGEILAAELQELKRMVLDEQRDIATNV